MKIQRVFSIANKETFKIPHIRKILNRYVINGENWIDPFAGDSNIAGITNDLNPNKPTMFHMHAEKFALQLTGKYDGVLFDPPYSLTQVKQCYNGIGMDLFKDDTNNFPFRIKSILAEKIKLGGYAICFGWNSSGFGKYRGFQMVEIFIINHGGNKNDTIITVEQKYRETLF